MNLCHLPFGRNFIASILSVLFGVHLFYVEERGSTSTENMYDEREWEVHKLFASLRMTPLPPAYGTL